jgi:hypothetical protein
MITYEVRHTMGDGWAHGPLPGTEHHAWWMGPWHTYQLQHSMGHLTRYRRPWGWLGPQSPIRESKTMCDGWGPGTATIYPQYFHHQLSCSHVSCPSPIVAPLPCQLAWSYSCPTPIIVPLPCQLSCSHRCSSPMSVVLLPCQLSCSHVSCPAPMSVVPLP